MQEEDGVEKKRIEKERGWCTERKGGGGGGMIGISTNERGRDPPT